MMNLDTLSSPTVRSGNVLALLNTLYTSGFAMATPSTPMLKGRTMHTLYALSFIVYVLNCISDWFHVWATLQGKVTSFPLDVWIAVLLVSVSVTGSMLTWLLLMLCMENAFAHRLDITPYRSGFALALEAIVEWIQAFNSFRVSFLVMTLHDFPMTIINFFFLPSCRCAGPTVTPWTLLFSSITTIFSLVWRVNMLYFSYRRMLCPPRTADAGLPHMPTPRQHLKWATDISNGGRLNEYDEMWPVRWAKSKVYGVPNEDKEKLAQNKVNGKIPPLLTLPVFSQLATAVCKCLWFVKSVFLFIFCFILSIFAYIFYLLTCFAPYFYHYTCRRNSFYHRHKCVRSFIRYYSSIFHYSVFLISLVLSASLIGLNILLISSVHVLGSNSFPPEIDRICITTSPQLHTIYATVLPNYLFDIATVDEIVNRMHVYTDEQSSTVCKPLWEDGGLGLGWKRKAAGPWQTRRQLNNSLLAVTTQVVFENSDKDDAHIEVVFDYAEIKENLGHSKTCVRGNMTKWRFEPSLPKLKPPYFVACRSNWRFTYSALTECSSWKGPTTTAKPKDGWIRPNRTRHRPRPKQKTQNFIFY